MAALEGAEAALASSLGHGGRHRRGLRAVLDRRPRGRAAPALLGPSTLFTAHLARFGIDVTFVDGTDPQQFADAVRPGRTQLVFVETPANPALSLTDIAAVAGIPGRSRWSTRPSPHPCCSSPRLGADLVLHAATKGLAGYNDALLGVVAGSRDLIDGLGWHVVQGGQASPFDAWNGLRASAPCLCGSSASAPPP